MNVNLRGEKIEITEAMRDYAKDKFQKLSKYLVNQEELMSHLLFKKNGEENKLEITLPLNNFTLRIEEIGNDFYSTVDTAIDKLERQLVKNKTKLSNKKMKDKMDFVLAEFDDIEDDNNKTIVKRKKIELKPMDEDEAILQMELLGHDFYVFKNIEDGKIAVLYRRKNNDYGLIEEE